MKQIIQKNILFLLAILVLFACKKDLDDIKSFKENGIELVDWEPTFVAPLLNTRTTLGEAYTEMDTLVKRLNKQGVDLLIREDGVFNLQYLYDYETGGMNSYYKIPRETQSIEFIVPEEAKAVLVALPVGAPITGVWDTTITFDIDPDYGALLEYIELGGGTIDISYNHDFNQNIGVEVTMRSITNMSSGDTLRMTMLGQNVTRQEILDNHEVKLSYLDENNVKQYNRVEINVKTIGTITNPILTGEKFTLDISMGDYYFNFGSGYLGVFDAAIPSGRSTFNLFETLDLDGVFFKEPKLTFDIQNTVGMPMRMFIDTLDLGYPDNSTESLGVNGKVTLINGVSTRSDIPNNPALSRDSIDNTNSRLSELLTSEPNKIDYAIHFTSYTPNGEDQFAFFIADTSQLKVRATAELPMILSVFEYSFADTFKLDSLVTKENQDTANKYVDRAELKLVFETQLPFNVDVQAYFVDSNNVVLAKAFDNGPHTVLANDDLDAEGVVRSVKDVVTFVPIDQAKFNQIVGATKIIVEAKASTSQAQLATPRYVQIKSDYVFGIRAGILAKFKYDVPTIELK